MKTLLATTALAGLMAMPAFAQSADTSAPADGGLVVHDLNADGVIDMADLEMADTNGDGVVDASDEPQMAEGMESTMPAEGSDTETAEGTDATMEPAEGEDAEMAEGTDATMEPAEGEDAEMAEGTDATMEPAEGEEAEMAEGTDATMEPAEGEDAEVAEGTTVTTVPAEGEEAEMAEGTDATVAPADGTMAPADGTDAEMAEGNETDASEIDTEAEQADARDITGERVYDSNDEWIGEVSEMVIADGKTWAIVDVGGFLGIGEKPVALDLSELDIQTDAETDDIRISVGMSKEELEALPTFEKS